MSECTCQCRDNDPYRLLAFPTAEEMDAEVNRLLKLRTGWRVLGELMFANGGYRREMIREPDKPDKRYWLIPYQSQPVQH